MNELDDKIKEALRAADAELADEFREEPAMLQQVIDTFQTRNRWLVAWSMLMSIIFMALAIYCLVQFLRGDEATTMLKWMLGVIFCFSAVSMFKIWFWMELNKNSIMREVKRMELQLARMKRQAE